MAAMACKQGATRLSPCQAVSISMLLEPKCPQSVGAGGPELGLGWK